MDFTYQRVVLKISGEALSGAQKMGIDFEFVAKLAKILKKIHISTLYFYFFRKV